MTRYLAACVVLCVALASSTASAAITAFWQQNTITPNAIASDPLLANMQSWSLRVTTDGNWASAGMEAILPAGNVYYHNAFGGNTKPNPTLVAAFPALEFDTYVTAPGDTGTAGAPAILGFFPEAPGTGDFGGTTGRFSVSWGDLVDDLPGTYEIARLTFPLGVLPDIRNLDPDPQTTSPSRTSQVNPDSSSIIPDIPEPTSLGLIAAAGLLAIRRRTA